MNNYFRSLVNFRSDAIFSLVIIVLLASCSPAKQVVTTEIKPMPAERILRKLERNSPRYRTYAAKKVSVSYQKNDDKNVFKSQVKIKKDDCVIASVNKLSFPLGKARVTSDKVEFLSFSDKSYMSQDLVPEVNPMEELISNSVLEAIITNSYRVLSQQLEFKPEVEAMVVNNKYVLKSKLDATSAVNENNDNLKSIASASVSKDDLSFSVEIDPTNFRISSIKVQDDNSGAALNVNYGHFIKVERDWYPQYIKIEVTNNNDLLSLELKLSRISINSERNFTYKVPDSYDRLRLKLFN